MSMSLFSAGRAAVGIHIFTTHLHNIRDTPARNDAIIIVSHKFKKSVTQ